MFTNSRHDFVFITEVDCVVLVRKVTMLNRVEYSAWSIVNNYWSYEVSNLNFPAQDLMMKIDWISVAKLWRNFILPVSGSN